MNGLIPAATAVPALLDRLQSWARAADGAYSPNTERAWRAHWANWSTWCSSAGACPLPAAPEAIATFLREQSAAGVAVGTVRKRVEAIHRLHIMAGLERPCRAEEIRLALRAIARARGTAAKQAPGLCSDDAASIRAHVEVSGPRMRDLRDVALLLVGRDLLARASELVSVTRETIELRPDGTAIVMLRRHKTSTEARPHLIGPRATTALLRWLEASGIASGHVFVSITKGGRVKGRALRPCDVSRILENLGRRARLEPRFTSHSLRVGMAQDLTEANVETNAIMQAGGWSNPSMLARYTSKLRATRGAIARFYRVRGT
jgi:integrase